MVQKFKDGIENVAKREFDYLQAFEIMRVNPAWFVDERTLELIQTYLFYRPNPSQAFSGKISEQPHLWIDTKILLDGIFPTM